MPGSWNLPARFWTFAILKWFFSEYATSTYVMPPGVLCSLAGDARAAAGADADREVRLRALADRVLPRLADVRQVVGEVVARAAAVAAVDRHDLLVRQLDARVDLLDRRVVPVLDRAAVDRGEDRARQLEAVADAADVVRDRGGRERPRDLDAALAGGGLVGRQRSVARPEVDRAGRDRGDAATAADAAVVDGRTVVVLRPRGHERHDEGAAGSRQRGGRPRRRQAGPSWRTAAT